MSVGIGRDNEERHSQSHLLGKQFLLGNFMNSNAVEHNDDGRVMRDAEEESEIIQSLISKVSLGVFFLNEIVYLLGVAYSHGKKFSLRMDATFNFLHFRL